MSDPRVAIILLNWNGWKDTIECLESLFRQDYNAYQVIVCDNNSSDESEAKILQWCDGEIDVETSPDSKLQHLTQPSVKRPIRYERITKVQVQSKDLTKSDASLILIQNEENLGFAGGNNSGLRLALINKFDYCWLLNNDTVVEPDCLRKMVEHTEALTKLGIKNTCGSVQCFYDDPNIIQALGGFSFNPKSAITSETFGRYLERSNYSAIDHTAFIEKLDAIHGCSWLLSRAFLTEIGLMDDRYFLYYEEIDWALRAKGKFKLTYASNAFVYHKEGASIGSKSFNRARSAFSEYNIHKSRMRFVRKHLPKRLPMVALFSIMQAANRFRQGLFANGRAIFRALLRAQY